MRLLTIPAELSEEDNKQRRMILKALDRLRRDYILSAEPYHTALVNIEGRNPPRVVLVPEEGDDVPEYVTRLVKEMGADDV